jgi:hypothetical protein
MVSQSPKLQIFHNNYSYFVTNLVQNKLRMVGLIFLNCQPIVDLQYNKTQIYGCPQGT